MAQHNNFVTINMIGKFPCLLSGVKLGLKHCFNYLYNAKYKAQLHSH